MGQALVAAGAVALVAALVVVALSTTVLATSRARAATPDLLAIDAATGALVDAVAAELPALVPPGALDAVTARAVAERMVRDSTFVEGSRDAVASAHAAWRDGGDLRLRIPSDVSSPAALAAFRDVDLGLSRSLPSPLVLPPVEVAIDITDATVPTDLRSTGLVVAVAGALAVVVGSFLDPRTDRALRRTAGAVALGAGALALVAVVAPVVGIDGRGPALPAAVAMIGVSRTPLLLVAGAAALVAAFGWATANQVAPLVDRRERRRDRRQAGPPPATSGAQASRRRGRAVRQQAIDAFFDDEESEGTPGASEPLEVGERETPLVDYRGDGFDEAVAAVDADPRGGTTGRSEAGSESETGAEGKDDDRASGAAADRREALERIDGARNRLRTHLPR